MTNETTITTENLAENKKLRREARELRKNLKKLSEAVLLHVHFMDQAAMKEKTIPRPVSEKLAQLVNRLELANDSIRRYGLDLDEGKKEKEKIVQKLLKEKK